ncbi:hypothetical protein FOZ63_017145, partial [Perkinsus olseni]
ASKDFTTLLGVNAEYDMPGDVLNEPMSSGTGKICDTLTDEMVTKRFRKMYSSMNGGCISITEGDVDRREILFRNSRSEALEPDKHDIGDFLLHVFRGGVQLKAKVTTRR